MQHSGRISVIRISEKAGASRLMPGIEHRLRLHASPATWTSCPETGKRFLRRRGDIDVIPAGQSGGFDAETAFEALEVRLPVSLIQQVADEAAGATSGSRLQLRHMLADEAIGHLSWALERGVSDKLPAGSLYFDSIGTAIATRLLGVTETAPAQRRGLTSVQLRRIMDYIDAHIDGPLTLELLSKVAGASSAHLRYWFKAQTGSTIHQFVMRHRVERARALLMQSEASTMDVALAAGFSHQSHLARWMRRELGLSPRELRRNA